MTDARKEHDSAHERPATDSEIYDSSVANDATAQAEDDGPVVESNSSNYGASSVVGKQGDA